MTDSLYKKIPSVPGVYFMKNAAGEILYIGKAVNLRRRVSSYFKKVHEYRIEKLVGQIKKIDYKKTDTGLEALILESQLIKKHQPPFNVLEKDDKSFLYIEITKEKFPRVLLVRGKDKPAGERYGPFVSGSSVREALKIIRHIFPYSTHEANRKYNRPCFDHQIGLCPGTCIGAVNENTYQKTIKNIKLFFAGKKGQILKSLEKEMRLASKNLKFEEAEKLKRQIFSLKHIQDIAFISESPVHDSQFKAHNSFRVEGYDISNISGTSAVGSMVVFVNGKPDKNSYRKFKIYTVKGPDDTGMIKEVLSRRLKHPEWPLPNLILIDGGRGQVNAAKSALFEFSFKISVLGIAKGSKRKRNDIIGIIPAGIEKDLLIKVRDEAHRFAVNYHKKLRRNNLSFKA